MARKPPVPLRRTEIDPRWEGGRLEDPRRGLESTSTWHLIHGQSYLVRVRFATVANHGIISEGGVIDGQIRVTYSKAILEEPWDIMRQQGCSEAYDVRSGDGSWGLLSPSVRSDDRAGG